MRATCQSSSRRLSWHQALLCYRRTLAPSWQVPRGDAGLLPPPVQGPGGGHHPDAGKRRLPPAGWLKAFLSFPVQMTGRICSLLFFLYRMDVASSPISHVARVCPLSTTPPLGVPPPTTTLRSACTGCLPGAVQRRAGGAVPSRRGAAARIPGHGGGGVQLCRGAHCGVVLAPRVPADRWVPGGRVAVPARVRGGQAGACGKLLCRLCVGEGQGGAVAQSLGQGQQFRGAAAAHGWPATSLSALLSTAACPPPPHPHPLLPRRAQATATSAPSAATTRSRTWY